jgi:hypothetical protein
MARKRKGVGAIMAKAAAGAGRSLLFRWMYENYEGLTAAASGKRFGWRSLCEEFARAGLTDSEGKAPTILTAKKTWQRVQREAEKRRAAPSAGLEERPKKERSQAALDWRPEPIRPEGREGGKGEPTPRGPIEKSGTDPASDSQSDYEGLTDEEASRLSLLRFRRHLASRSGRDPNKVK